ncbi:CGNR zinc finger domain-containing protein [Mycobacterium sp. 1423905.2]|uniref:CGNR zinc finger domain-containing protein n=1 Tax=Mycobacterium sp. 1423905.2 TaxID=1856859 RepID=UPI000800FBA1|nr:CGNR zinc finger domain-containing protein [Mycobacterium sp. 1423905.2]OBJ52386.1 hypothetical protein A9W95_20290 [Mycobacterium sp. 1423905.2]
MVSAAGELDMRGGHPVVDFVNTVAWRGDSARQIDYLVDYPDLVAWCRLAKVLTAAEARQLTTVGAATQRILDDGKRLREALHAAWTDGNDLDEVIATMYRGAMRERRLRIADDRIMWTEDELTSRTPVYRIVVSAVELLTRTPRSRVKRCDDAACGWLFLDSSHRQNRRWCSAADCGNRERARRHYQRNRR